MVKSQRNIRCSVCGKTYVNPNAAQKHAQQKHPAPVVPQLPGNVGAQWTTGMSINVGDTRAVHTSPPPQRAQPNLGVHVRPSTTNNALMNHHVAARLEIRSRQSTAVSKTLYCSLCPHRPNFRSKWHLKTHRQQWHPTIHKCTICSARMDKKELRKHVKELHGISLRAMIKHSKKPTKIANNKEQTTLVCSPTESSNDDGQLSSEDGEHLLLEDEGQTSSEDEQRSPPEGKGEHSAWGNQQSSSWDLPADAGAKAREIRNLNKKLRAIEELKEKAWRGKRLQATQLEEIDREAEIRKALAEVSIS